MKPKPEMIEGLEAFERFRRAVKTVLSIPKSAIIEDGRKVKRKGKSRTKRSGP